MKRESLCKLVLAVALVGLIACFFAGCGLQESAQKLDQSRQDSYAAKTTTDFVRAAKGNAAAPSAPLVGSLTVTGSKSTGATTVTIAASQPASNGAEENTRATSGATEGGTTAWANIFSDTASFPLFVKIIGLVIAIVLVWEVGKRGYAALKASQIGPAVATMSTLAANEVNSVASHAMAMASAATDPAVKAAHLQTAVAALSAKSNIINASPGPAATPVSTSNTGA